MHFFTAQQVGIMTAAAAGSFVALLVTRKPGWLHVLTLFFVGELTAFYWSDSVIMLLGWSQEYVKNVAFTIGAVGMLLWGGVLNLFQKVNDDPFGTISDLWGLWRGQGTNDSRKSDDH